MACVLAVCFILQPWRKTFKPTLTAKVLGYITGCLGGIFGAAEIIIVFYYQFLQNTLNQLKTLFWTCIVGATVSVGPLFIEKFNFELSWTDWLLITGHCAAYVIIMPLYMYSSACVPSIVSIIGSTSTLYVVLAQYTVLSGINPGNRNSMEYGGIILVICSSVVPSIFKAWKQKSHDRPTDKGTDSK